MPWQDDKVVMRMKPTMLFSSPPLAPFLAWPGLSWITCEPSTEHSAPTRYSCGRVERRNHGTDRDSVVDVVWRQEFGAIVEKRLGIPPRAGLCSHRSQIRRGSRYQDPLKGFVEFFRRNVSDWEIEDMDLAEAQLTRIIEQIGARKLLALAPRAPAF